VESLTESYGDPNTSLANDISTRRKQRKTSTVQNTVLYTVQNTKEQTMTNVLYTLLICRFPL